MQVKAFKETVAWMIWSLLNNLSCLLNIPYWVHHTTAKHFAVLQTLDKPCFVYSKVRVNYPAETEGDRGRRARRKQKEAASYVNQFPALNTSLEVKQIFCIKIHCFSVCISAHGRKNGYTWTLNYIFSIGKKQTAEEVCAVPQYSHTPMLHSTLTDCSSNKRSSNSQHCFVDTVQKVYLDLYHRWVPWYSSTADESELTMEKSNVLFLWPSLVNKIFESHRREYSIVNE